MKTGAFAKKHAISPTTVSFYIKQGLLLPATVNGKYDFRDSDDRDMKLIAELKQWQFSLDDIGAILSEARLTQDSARPATGRFLRILAGRREELLAERVRIGASLSSLEDTMQKLESAQKNRRGVSRGIDVRFLPFLYCYRCNERLTMRLDAIEEGEVHSGTLSCSCGYQAVIEDGVIVNPVNENRPPVPPQQNEHAAPEALSMDMRNHLYRVYSCLEEMLREFPPKGGLIVETFVGRSSFLLQRAKALDPSALYVFCDPTRESIFREKNHLDDADQRLNFMSIVSNFRPFPLKWGSADIMIDCFRNAYFDMFTDALLFPTWMRYLHRGSRIIGVYMGVTPNSRSARRYRDHYPDSPEDILSIQAFRQNLSRYGFLIEREQLMEPLSTSHFSWHQPGDALYYYCYCARLQDDPAPPKPGPR